MVWYGSVYKVRKGRIRRTNIICDELSAIGKCSNIYALRTDRQRDRQGKRETDRQTDRQAGRQAGRQTDRQTYLYLLKQRLSSTNWGDKVFYDFVLMLLCGVYIDIICPPEFTRYRIYPFYVYDISQYIPWYDIPHDIWHDISYTLQISYLIAIYRKIPVIWTGLRNINFLITS